MLTGVFGIFQNEMPVVRDEDRRFLQSSDNTILSPFFRHFSHIFRPFLEKYLYISFLVPRKTV